MRTSHTPPIARPATACLVSASGLHTPSTILIVRGNFAPETEGRAKGSRTFADLIVQTNFAPSAARASPIAGGLAGGGAFEVSCRALLPTASLEPLFYVRDAPASASTSSLKSSATSGGGRGRGRGRVPINNIIPSVSYIGTYRLRGVAARRQMVVRGQNSDTEPTTHISNSIAARTLRQSV